MYSCIPCYVIVHRKDKYGRKKCSFQAVFNVKTHGINGNCPTIRHQSNISFVKRTKKIQNVE